MNVIITDNYDEMSKYTAKLIADFIKAKPDCVLGLATGSTPIGTYRELARMHKEEGLDFSNVKTFNLDEYLGVGMEKDKPYDLDQSYARFMYEELFSQINIKKENTRVPDGLTKDPENYCKWYEEEIEKAGGIDLQLLGIGGDGHWAFNEPGSSLSSRTRIEELTQQTLDDNYESFYKKAGIAREQMPHHALTMGIGTILEAAPLSSTMVTPPLCSCNAEAVIWVVMGPSMLWAMTSAFFSPLAIIIIFLASKLQNVEQYTYTHP